MKIAIMILMLLVVSLTILTGCGSTESEPLTNPPQDPQAQDTQQDQQQTGSGKIPEPPALPRE
jgi:predicted small lipoprotein YifL